MYKNGHRGLSLFLSAPIVAVLVSYELGVLALVFVVSVFSMPSIPDIDIHLQEYTPITHRGITHTVWFAMFFGVLYAGFVFGGMIYFGIEEVLTYTTVSLWEVLAFSWFTGFCVIMFHILGDVITPMGVKVFSRDNRGGFSLNFVLAKNRIANETSIVIGLLSLVFVAVLTQYPHLHYLQSLPSVLIFCVGYVGLFGLWLFISTTRVGKFFYRIFSKLTDF